MKNCKRLPERDIIYQIFLVEQQLKEIEERARKDPNFNADYDRIWFKAIWFKARCSTFLDVLGASIGQVHDSPTYKKYSRGVKN